jgi:anti-anti-sigma regulatory factor
MNIIKFDNDVSVKNIKLFRDSLLEGIVKAERELIIDFTNQKRADLAVMQVLIAAHNEAKLLKKKIKLSNVSPELKKGLIITGLIK